MSKVLDSPRGRMLLLITVLILLAGMIVLVYTHPDKKQLPQSKGSNYEQNIRDIWYKQLSQLVSGNDFHNAKLAANKILHSIPEDLFARRVLVKIAAEEKNYDSAMQLCRDILLKNPEDPLTRNNLAVLHFFTSAPNDAKTEIAIAASLAPEHPVIDYNRKLLTGSDTPKSLPALLEIPSDLLIIPLPQTGVAP